MRTRQVYLQTYLYTRTHTTHNYYIIIIYTSYYYYIDIIFPWPPPIEPRSDNRDGAITNNIIILCRYITHITVKK